MSDPEQAVRDRAVELLARREHSRRELARKLKGKGFPPEAIEPVVDALAAEGLQSDARFTESYIHHRAARGYGPGRIRQELKQRGISEEQMDPLFEAMDIDWQAEAARVREKKFGAALPEGYRERMRQSRFLQYRGFDGDRIKTLFRPDD